MATSDKMRAKTEIILNGFIKSPKVDLVDNLQRNFNSVGNI